MSGHAPSPPIFLDEGLACYFGSFRFYRAIADKYLDQLNIKPTVDQLTNYYDKIPASDVFSFLFIDFLIKTEGQQYISTIIRVPQSLKSKNSDWVKFLAN